MHRVGQFVSHLTARVTPDDEAAAHRVLPANAWELFDRMPVADRRHGLDVAHRLLAQGIDDRDQRFAIQIALRLAERRALGAQLLRVHAVEAQIALVDYRRLKMQGVPTVFRGHRLHIGGRRRYRHGQNFYWNKQSQRKAGHPLNLPASHEAL